MATLKKSLRALPEPPFHPKHHGAIHEIAVKLKADGVEDADLRRTAVIELKKVISKMPSANQTTL